eukprot:5178-Rhodomonas_salina.1
MLQAIVIGEYHTCARRLARRCSRRRVRGQGTRHALARQEEKIAVGALKQNIGGVVSRFGGSRLSNCRVLEARVWDLGFEV